MAAKIILISIIIVYFIAIGFFIAYLILSYKEQVDRINHNLGIVDRLARTVDKAIDIIKE
jgi:hypothetical protein